MVPCAYSPHSGGYRHPIRAVLPLPGALGLRWPASTGGRVLGFSKTEDLNGDLVFFEAGSLDTESTLLFLEVFPVCSKGFLFLGEAGAEVDGVSDVSWDSCT